MNETDHACCVCWKKLTAVPDGTGRQKVEGCHIISKKYGKLWFCQEHTQGGFMKQIFLYKKARSVKA